MTISLAGFNNIDRADGTIYSVSSFMRNIEL